jgi:N6-L-threonylcarbamoyladenine synthase
LFTKETIPVILNKTAYETYCIIKYEKSKDMKILSIETSCDDTSIAIIKGSNKKSPRFEVLSNIISSQIDIHKEWGGVVPMIAKREHQKNLLPILKRALKKANLLEKSVKGIEINDKILDKILEREQEHKEVLKAFLKRYKKPKVDAIAITIGPGLEPCLWAGVNFVKALSQAWDIKIIPVNHIEGHIYSSIIKNKEKISFPAIALIVSGGHTQIILVKELGKYKIIGETRDDAAGECFDKISRILGLGYPGGPIISKEADLCKSSLNIKLPRPMISQKNYDFSFSGLKTAVLYLSKSISNNKKLTKTQVRAIAKESQQSIIDVLIKKTKQAIRKYDAESFILGGGVSANKELKKQFKKVLKEYQINIFFPNKNLSTDNAVMIGAAAYSNFQKGVSKNWKQIKPNANLRL